MEENDLVLSSLPKTWIVDIDGTIVEHNGHLNYGKDKPLHRSLEFLSSIPDKDMVILLTSRSSEYAVLTERTLREANIRYDQIIYGVPMGERVLINDRKESGLKTAYAINLMRNEGINVVVKIDPTL